MSKSSSPRQSPRNTSTNTSNATVFKGKDVADLMFVEQEYQHGTQVVAYLMGQTEDGRDTTRIIRPGTEQFVPIVYDAVLERTYRCLIRKFGSTELCWPTMPHLLDPTEWLPFEEFVMLLKKQITFHKETRPNRDTNKPETKWIGHTDKGKVCILEGGDDEVNPSGPTLVLCRHSGPVLLCTAVPRQIQGTKALVTFAESKGFNQYREADKSQILVERAFPKEGVLEPKSKDDVVVKKLYRNIYELLSVKTAKPPLIITAGSGHGDIRKAMRTLSNNLHPEKLEILFKGKMSFLDKLNATLFFDGLNNAFQKAKTNLDEKDEAAKAKEDSAKPQPAAPVHHADPLMEALFGDPETASVEQLEAGLAAAAWAATPPAAEASAPVTEPPAPATEAPAAITSPPESTPAPAPEAPTATTESQEPAPPPAVTLPPLNLEGLSAKEQEEAIHNRKVTEEKMAKLTASQQKAKTAKPKTKGEQRRETQPATSGSISDQLKAKGLVKENGNSTPAAGGQR